MHFFDPQGSRYHWLNIAFANRRTLVEGFSHASAYEDGWSTHDISILTIIDANQYKSDGNCIMYCVLVGVLCIRFRIGQPKLVAKYTTLAMEEIDKDSNVAGSVGVSRNNIVELGVNHARSSKSNRKTPRSG